MSWECYGLTCNLNRQKTGTQIHSFTTSSLFMRCFCSSRREFGYKTMVCFSMPWAVVSLLVCPPLRGIWSNNGQVERIQPRLGLLVSFLWGAPPYSFTDCNDLRKQLNSNYIGCWHCNRLSHLDTLVSGSLAEVGELPLPWGNDWRTEKVWAIS